MTTLNTIIEEEKKGAKESILETFEDGTMRYCPRDLETKITTAMQRAYEAGVKEEGERIDTKLNMLLDYPLIHRDMRQALDAIKDTFELNQDKK